MKNIFVLSLILCGLFIGNAFAGIGKPNIHAGIGYAMLLNSVEGSEVSRGGLSVFGQALWNTRNDRLKAGAEISYLPIWSSKVTMPIFNPTTGSFVVTTYDNKASAVPVLAMVTYDLTEGEGIKFIGQGGLGLAFSSAKALGMSKSESNLALMIGAGAQKKMNDNLDANAGLKLYIFDVGNTAVKELLATVGVSF